MSLFTRERPFNAHGSYTTIREVRWRRVLFAIVVIAGVTLALFT